MRGSHQLSVAYQLIDCIDLLVKECAHIVWSAENSGFMSLVVHKPKTPTSWQSVADYKNCETDDKGTIGPA